MSEFIRQLIGLGLFILTVLLLIIAVIGTFVTVDTIVKIILTFL